MRVLLNKCDEYATEFNIVFNASKFCCLLVNCNRRKQFCCNNNPVFYINGKPIVYVNNPVFYINGKPIVYVNQYSHLGHIISVDLNEKTDILHLPNAMVNQINIVLSYF